MTSRLVRRSAAELSLRELNRYVLAKQGLGGTPRQPSDLLTVVDDLVGLHAQRPHSPYLSLHARVRPFRREALDRALFLDRSMLRTHAMRGTVHVIPLGQYETVLTATVGQLDRMYTRALGQLANRAALERRVLAVIEERGPLTHSELAQAAGLTVEPRILFHLLNWLCTRRALVKTVPIGSWRSALYRYELLSRWQPNIPRGISDPIDARAVLIERYLRCYGPATLRDIAWWTGLSQVAVRRGLQEMEQPYAWVHFSPLDTVACMLEDDLNYLGDWRAPDSVSADLLPSFDPYMVAYADRDRLIDVRHYRRVFRGVAGLIEPTILIDGRVSGIWRYRVKNGALEHELFERLPVEAWRPLKCAMRRTAQFLLAAEHVMQGDD